MDGKYDPRIKTWYVCFCDPEKLVRGQKYLKLGFRHCYAFGFDEDAGKWILFNPGWEGIVLRIVANPNRMMAEAAVSCFKDQRSHRTLV